MDVQRVKEVWLSVEGFAGGVSVGPRADWRRSSRHVAE